MLYFLQFQIRTIAMWCLLLAIKSTIAQHWHLDSYWNSLFQITDDCKLREVNLNSFELSKHLKKNHWRIPKNRRSKTVRRSQRTYKFLFSHSYLLHAMVPFQSSNENMSCIWTSKIGSKTIFCQKGSDVPTNFI